MKLAFITSNPAKVALANERLNRYGIEVVLQKASMMEPQTFDVEEVASQKAAQLVGKIDVPFIVEDSGLYIARLNGFPGALMKPVLDSIGAARMLKLMDGESDRTALVKSVLAYCDPKTGKTTVFTGNYDGTMSDLPRGENLRGWKVAGIFIPRGSKKTLAEMDDREWESFLEDFRKGDHYEKFGKWATENVK